MIVENCNYQTSPGSQTIKQLPKSNCFFMPKNSSFYMGYVNYECYN